jgi:hypothetical protein
MHWLWKQSNYCRVIKRKLFQVLHIIHIITNIITILDTLHYLLKLLQTQCSRKWVCYHHQVEEKKCCSLVETSRKKHFWSLDTDVHVETSSNESNWVETYPPSYSMMATHPISKTLCLKKLKMLDSIQHNSDVHHNTPPSDTATWWLTRTAFALFTTQ